MTRSQPFVCLFTVPKPFSDLAAVQQTNAITSWTRLGDGVEILLCGNEEGVAEAARGAGVRHVPEIARNEFGTPLVDSAFDAAARHSQARLLCFINTDIILMSDFVQAIERVNLPEFVVCGRRWDLELRCLLDFNAANWECNLRARIRQTATLHSAEGMDYFVFRRGLFREMPSFAIGRTIWDNWLLFHARSLRVPLIDATSGITIAHQNHTYSHVEGGVEGAWHGPEARRNRLLGSEMLFPFSIRDATYELTPCILQARSAARDPIRRMQAQVALALRGRPSAVRLVRRLLRAKAT